MERRDENDLRPGPPIITFTGVVLRYAIITKKASLQKTERMDTIFIKADEPLHIQQANGDESEARHNRIMINCRLYMTDTIQQIPPMYLSPVKVPDRAQARASAPSDPDNHEQEINGGRTYIRH